MQSKINQCKVSLQKCLLQDWLSSKLIWIYHTITHSSYNFFWAILCNKQFFVYLQTVPIILMGISGVFKKNKHIFKFKTQTDYSKWRDVKSGLNLFGSEACLHVCEWLVSDRGSLVSVTTALPTEPQPLPDAITKYLPIASLW